MEFKNLIDSKTAATVHFSRFRGSSGVVEYHFMIQPNTYADAAGQLLVLHETYTSALTALGLNVDSAVFRRYFSSDLYHHADVLARDPLSSCDPSGDPCAISWVEQPPIPPSKLALWAYHIHDPAAPRLSKCLSEDTLIVDRRSVQHLWTTQVTASTKTTTYDQTATIVKQYIQRLKDYRCSLAENAVRTWFFVRDIDSAYAEFVSARRELYMEQGLTPQTHFIASTGVEGAYVQQEVKVVMDAYAIGGLRKEQVTFLHAPDHMNPPHNYGVTFERGVSVAYRDRKHLIISGTASIGPDGQIWHLHDVSRQLRRTIENIQALLKNAGATLRDLAFLIGYVRDPSDGNHVLQGIRENLGDIPVQIVTASVCRPGWLVELEGIAIVPSENPSLPPF